ncbi:uncharacterized protein LOC103524116 [Trichonephila clavipes]|nr:uncharacterized protein LOC103524116 [Trichonephila clavipes]
MLRLITGKAKPTSIAAVELQTDLEPLMERSQKSTLNLVEKILRRNNFLNYYRPTNERLKTHKSFLSTVHDLYDTFDILTPNHQVFPQEFNPILCQVTLESHLNLVWNVDGSVEDDIKNSIFRTFSSAFSISYPVGKYCDNFDDEIVAISFAIDKLENCSERNIAFFIDSQAAILSLINSRYNENALVHSCRIKLIELEKSRKSVALQWISSHCSISGNEKADRLPKAGYLMSQPDSHLPLRNIKRLIYSKLKN